MPLYISVLFLLNDNCFHLPPLYSGSHCSGAADSSSPRVLPEFAVFRVVRLVPGSRDLPHGTDALLVAGAHVGRQLPHGCTPAGRGSYICFPEDPLPAKHQRHQSRRGRRPDLEVDSSLKTILKDNRDGFHFNSCITSYWLKCVFIRIKRMIKYKNKDNFILKITSVAFMVIFVLFIYVICV